MDSITAKTNPVLRRDGAKVWYNKQGDYHRDNGPAIIYKDGDETWFKNGVLHRDDGPAICHTNGYKAWYKNGQPHRDDGPAIIRADGSSEWYKDGKRLYFTGPITSPNGDETWYKNGLLHRDDGPAIIRPDGIEEWYKNGAKQPTPAKNPIPAEKPTLTSEIIVIRKQAIKNYFADGVIREITTRIRSGSHVNQWMLCFNDPNRLFDLKTNLDTAEGIVKDMLGDFTVAASNPIPGTLCLIISL